MGGETTKIREYKEFDERKRKMEVQRG